MKHFVWLTGIVLMMTFRVNAQVPSCDPTVPYFFVDLTGAPAGVWTSPWHERDGYCCGVTGSDRCTSFDIVLDSNAAMINFEIAGGAVPSGSMYYQIDCGPPVAVGEPICITGTGPFHVTFCKPGNNENIYRITSIPKPTFPKDDTVRIGCQTYLSVLGLETTGLTWQSVYPGPVGAYDSYLSCTIGCTSPLYTPPTGAPAYVDYKICGNPIADECGYVAVCDTVRIYNFSSMSGTVFPATGTFCSGSTGILLTASGSGGDGVYTYIWRDPSSSIVGTTSSIMANVAGTYTVEIRDGLYDAELCPPVYLSVPVIETFPPVVDAGLDQVLCASDPVANINATISNCTGLNWSGGDGTFIPSSSGTTILYEPSAAEVAAGSATLIAVSTGAGGGCVNDSDTLVIIYPPAVNVSINASSIGCFGEPSIITANVSGGAGPVNILWNNGAISSTISATAGNYCVNATDTLGCSAITCQNIVSPDPLNIIMSSVDATTGSDGSATASVSGGAMPYTFQWNDPLNQVTPTATGLIPGMYTVIVTDNNGCVISSSVIVNSLLCSGLQANASGTNVTCNSSEDGTGIASVTGGTPPYSYAWQLPLTSTNDTVSDLGAGTYLVLITDANNCVDAATITVVEPLQMTNVINHTDVSTTGGTDGSATTSTAGGVPPYSYSWSNGETSSIVNTLGSGVYSVNIFDSQGCSITDSVMINEPACTNFIIGTSSVTPTCYDGNNGAATVTVLNGTAPFSYTWSTGVSGITTLGTPGTSISGLSAGTYSVTVTDGIGCQTFQNIVITQPSALSASLAATMVQCHSSVNGTVELSVYGGTYPYTYSWSNGVISEDLFNVGPGSYSVIVTDANGCTTTQSSTVIQPDSMSVSISLNNVTCHDGNNGSIDVTVSGGTGTYTFNWSNGATTQDLDSLVSGIYALTVTDQNGCDNDLPIEIFINEPSDVMVSVITLDCPIPGSGESNATVTASGGSGNYQVSFDNGLSYQSPGNFSSLLPVDSTYFILVMDSNFCVTPVVDTLVVPAEVFVMSILHNQCFVPGDSLTDVTVAVGGGVGGHYNVSFDGGLTFLPNNVFDDSLAIGNSYTLVAVDSLGCASINYSITLPSALRPTGTVSMFNGNNVSCFGSANGSINASVSGGTSPYTFAWSTGQTTEDLVTLTAGTYTLTVTDSLGCSNDTVFVLTEPAALTSSIAHATNYNGFDVSCYGVADGGLIVSATGGTLPYGFQWSGGENTASVSGLLAGAYTVVITDANGCVLQDSTIIFQPDSLSVTAVIADVLCNGFNNGAIDVSVTGGVNPYSYSWSNGVSSEDINGLGQGNYTLDLIDQNGCTYGFNATVIELSPLNVDAAVQPVVCYQQSNGSIELTTTGGTAPYIYTWSVTGNQSTIDSLAAGAYVVWIADVNNCTFSDTFEVPQPDSLWLTIESAIQANGHHISYNGGSDGSIDLGVNGGTVPYTYAWSNGSVTEDISGLAAGTYTVMVEDANGCPQHAVIILEQPDPLQLPQGISPNNDGLNDVLAVKGLEAYPDNMLTIFNRWGNVVYKKENYENDWNGLFYKTNEMLPEGTYFVILEIDVPEKINLTGYIELRK